MKTFCSEFAHDYSSYTFAYALYAQKEPSDTLNDIYQRGFLPYSAMPEKKDICYMARSARVPLHDWQMTSENRRIAKKFDDTFEKERIPFDTFSYTEEFYTFCLDYFSKRHGPSAMPRARLELILDMGLVSTIVAYKKANEVVAYVFEVESVGMTHYWFSFYDLSLVNQSLGLWLMIDGIRDAKERGVECYYLGTVYGAKALYKTNFEPLEWWNGEQWVQDVKALRARSRGDDGRVVTRMDAWKEGAVRF